MSSCSGSRPNSSARSLPGGAVKLLYMHVLVVTILTLHVFRLAINSQNSWRLRCWQDSFHKNTGKWAFNEYLPESGSHRWGNIHPYILYIRNAIRNVSSMPHGSSSQDSSLSHARARADTHQLLLLVYLKEIFSLGELLPSWLLENYLALLLLAYHCWLVRAYLALLWIAFHCLLDQQLGQQCFEGFELINLKDGFTTLPLGGGGWTKLISLAATFAPTGVTGYQQVINWILDWGCVCMDGGDVGRRMVVTARLTKRNVCFKKFYLIVNFLIL